MAGPFDILVERLSAAGSLLVVTHGRPDGDALGSAAGLALSARAAGKQARVLVPDAVPSRYDWLVEGLDVASAGDFDALAAQVDAVVIVDTCAVEQLDGLEAGLDQHRDRIVVVDHHATADEIGAARWLDTSAAAAGVMVAELLDALGWPTADRVAEALMAAVTTDTGWFRFANTDARALRCVARFIESGAKPDALYRKIFQADRPQRLALLARTLASLELHCGERLAAMTIRKADFDATGATPDETENFVNEALRISSVEVSIIVVENGEVVRASLRSREGVDVSEIARRFGGGGHARAAGLRSDAPLDTLKSQLLDACAAALGCFPAG